MQFEWQGVFENWAKAWVRKQFWRVEHRFGSRQDALQQCAMVFAKCQQRYGNVVDNPRWFMALFKRMVIHHWITNSRLDSRQRLVELPEGTQLADQKHNGWPMMGAFSSEDRTLVDIWESASPALQQALSLLSSAGPRAIALLMDERISSDILNRRWQRFAGTHADHNIVIELRELLNAKEASHESTAAVVRRS